MNKTAALKTTKLSFVDLETTGLDPARHEIIEVACLVAEPASAGGAISWRVADELELKVKPTRLESADPEALRINGYRESDWLFAATLEQAMKTLAEKINDTVVVAQNVTFDWSFLERAFAAAGVTPKIFYHKLDLASMAYGKLFRRDDFQKFSLKALADYFGVENVRAHSALSDTRVTFQIFQKLMELP